MIALLWWTLAALASGTPETCEAELTPPPARLSVAWVSPVSARARNSQWLAIHPTSELQAWSKANPGAKPGRFLQHLGLRKRDKAPARAYKVVIFDTSNQVLCRPMEGREPPGVAGGVAVCAPQHDRVPGSDGCGRMVDAGTSQSGISVYRARWRDLANAGFCVIPLTRFLGADDPQ